MRCVCHPIIIFYNGLAVGVIVFNVKWVNDSNYLKFEVQEPEHAQSDFYIHLASALIVNFMPFSNLHIYNLTP